MVKIAPSILAADFSCLKDEIIKLDKANADLIHFDVMDGHFVPNITFGPMILESLKKYTKLPFDVHLMVKNPTKFIHWYAKAGADIITFHLEASENPLDNIKLIKQYGIKAGISVKPQTDISKILPFIDDIDLILIMSVEPGFGGQKFNNDTILRIKNLQQYIANKNVVIEVDGGINNETAKLCRDAKVDILVAGTSVFKNNNYKINIKELKGEI